MRSIRLAEAVEQHPPIIWSIQNKRFPWPSRCWQGAWVTESGYIIRAWEDEVLADEVRRVRA